MPSESVKVMVRVRPFNEREKAKNYQNIATIDTPTMQVSLSNPNNTETQKVFSYDAVFPPETAQQTVYEEAAFQLVESVLEGYNGTIFAYGQTGCGKTHTMMGVPDHENTKGIIPRAFAHIFGNIESTAHKNFLIRCSYIEIYNEEIHDLVGTDVRAKLELKENADKGLFIKNISMHIVKSIAEIEKIMVLGTKNRSVGETLMNKDSSRSHTVFTIYIEAAEIDTKGNQKITLGKLNLVDLAGSERQSKTQATGDRLKEANKINLSLSALGNVISALVDGKSSHIPYRDSKLTRLLQDSLGGNTKTVMIANISPAADSYDETLGTLRYASRAKNIKNQPRVNQDPKDALLKEYAEEIKRLKMLLENGGHQSVDNSIIANRQSETGLNGGRKGKFKDEAEEAYHTSKRQKTGYGEDYEEQIKKKNEEIINERKKREDLESKLVGMQSQLLVGGTTVDNKGSSGEPEEKKRYQEMLQKIREHKREHEALIREKEKKDEEIAIAEKKHVNLKEEVEEQRKTIHNLKKKYRAAVEEIKDLEREHEANKEDLLDTIRLLERDVQINNNILAYMLSPDELDRIKAAARWHDESNEFIIPPFVIRNKKVNFPKISRAKGLEMISEEWKNRDIEFQEEPHLDEENCNTHRSTKGKGYQRGSSGFDTNQDFEKTANGTQSNFFKKKTQPRKSIERSDYSQPESREAIRKTSIRFQDKAALESQVSITRDAVYSALQNVSKLPKGLTDMAFKKKNPLRNVHLEPISMPHVAKNMDDSRGSFSREKRSLHDTTNKFGTLNSLNMHDGLPTHMKGGHHKPLSSLNEVNNRMSHF